MHTTIKNKKAGAQAPASKKLATTYSRGSCTTTTIGKATFDGRVRDGIGSDHRLIVTKRSSTKQVFVENCAPILCLNSSSNHWPRKMAGAIKPHDQLVSVR